jgi:hypothetical protein
MLADFINCDALAICPMSLLATLRRNERSTREAPAYRGRAFLEPTSRKGLPRSSAEPMAGAIVVQRTAAPRRGQMLQKTSAGLARRCPVMEAHTVSIRAYVRSHAGARHRAR